MPKTELKAATVRNAKAAPGERVEIWDTLRPGFGLRVTDKGTKTYFVTFRLRGRKVRQTLGTVEQMTLAEARQAARDAIADAQAGKDPRKEKTGTVEALASDFLRLYAEPRLKPSSLRDTRRLLEKEILPKLGHRPIGEVTRSEIVDLLDKVASRAPYVANRTRAVLSKMFNWALGRGVLEASPVAGLPRPGVEAKRERVLTDKELACIWKACDTLPPVFRDYVRVLILTGQRRAQVAGMRRADVDLKAGIWTVPGDQMKSGRAHVLPLSKPVTATLKAMPEIEGAGLFFTTNGRTPVSGFSKMKAGLDKAAGVTGWRLHDLRRTMATGMEKLGVQRVVIGKVLDHADGSVTAIYARHDYLAEMKAALTAWAEHVEGLAKRKS